MRRARRFSPLRSSARGADARRHAELPHQRGVVGAQSQALRDALSTVRGASAGANDLRCCEGMMFIPGISFRVVDRRRRSRRNRE